MTDPLRPFAQMIRALWRSRASRTDRTRSAVHASSERSSARRTRGSLHARLISRIASVDAHDVRRMRETFVETVLLWELGDQLAHDPAFGDLVTQVSAQLASDPAVCARLQELLPQLASEARDPSRRARP